MHVLKKITFALAVASMTIPAHAAVKLTALQMISVESNGKIQGVGAHRFKTTNHGGQPCLFVIEGDDVNGTIVNSPCPAQNGINLDLSAGIHTYTIYAENANSYSWNNYSLNLYLDNSSTAQISAMAPANSTTPQFYPPFAINTEFTEDLQSRTVQSPNSLEYKTGATVVKITDFRVAAPSLLNKDRISPFEAKANSKPDYVAQFTVQVIAPPQISNGGVVNAASFSARVAPGSLFSIFGSDLATARQDAGAVPLPMSLAGASVTVGGKAAPLVFVSAGQINAQIPYDAPQGASIPVIVTVNGQASPVMNVAVVPAAPGVFQFGDKRAVMQNADGTVNTAENAAAANSLVVAYMTGGGEVDNPVPTGTSAGTGVLSRHKGTVTATVNGTMAEIQFAGLTPGFIGLTQVNLRIPSLAPGTYPLVISVDGQASTAANITVR